MDEMIRYPPMYAALVGAVDGPTGVSRDADRAGRPHCNRVFAPDE